MFIVLNVMAAGAVNFSMQNKVFSETDMRRGRTGTGALSKEHE
jgi:hypothetical protein